MYVCIKGIRSDRSRRCAIGTQRLTRINNFLQSVSPGHGSSALHAFKVIAAKGHVPVVVRTAADHPLHEAEGLPRRQAVVVAIDISRAAVRPLLNRHNRGQGAV